MSSDRSRPLDVLLSAVADVADVACVLDPSPTMRPIEVTQRLWNAARYVVLGQHGRLPRANEVVRQVSRWVGRPLRWREVLELAQGGS
jgi:hypothetical protein